MGHAMIFGILICQLIFSGDFSGDLSTDWSTDWSADLSADRSDYWSAVDWSTDLSADLSRRVHLSHPLLEIVSYVHFEL